MPRRLAPALLAALVGPLAGCTGSGASGPVARPPGMPETARTSALATAAAALQRDAPVTGLDVYLVGFHPLRLARVSGATSPASAGLYGVRAGAVLGLDHGALGKAWGYDVATQRVLWTSAPLPWPHYFVDPSGIGGSTSPRGDGLLLAVCAELGPPSAPGAGRPCLRPELAAVNR